MRCVCGAFSSVRGAEWTCKGDTFGEITVDFDSTLFVPKAALEASYGLNGLTSLQLKARFQARFGSDEGGFPCGGEMAVEGVLREDDMRNSIFRIISGAIFAVAALAGPSQAALRCELTMQSSASKTSCIDPASLNGQTVTVPENVTRIGRDGLALCALSHTSSQASDIAYVIDNSNSMDAWGFWVNPSTGDTSFYIPNCSKSVSGTNVAFRKRHIGASGVDSSWDTLVKISSTKIPSSVNSDNCKEANDPYSMRAEVVRVAMKYQMSLDSNSQAGMVEFSSKVQQRSPLRTLQGSGLMRLLDSTGLYDAGSGTLWTPPMNTALGWLSASKNSVKAIIIVSDGEPTDGSDYRRLLRSTPDLPKIYGIYLGSGVTKVAEMDSLTNISGGKYWIVPPSRPDSLQSVIRSIVGNVMSTETPGTTVLTNLTNGQKSTALTITPGQDSVFHLKLDSVVALDTGKNSVRLVSSWTDDQGKARSDTSAFVLNVSGAAATASGAIKGDTLFATACTDASSLAFLSTSTWKAIDTVSEGEGAFALELVTPDSLSFPTYVSVAERSGGDQESMSLTAAKAVASVTGAWVNQLMLAVPRPWSHKSGDGIVQAANGIDTIVGSWCYPRDARDCAEDILVVRALKSPYVQWVPRQVTGPSGSLVLEALLPGQVGATVDAIIYRAGKAIGSVTLRKVSDSLFRDTVNFRQGGLATGGDSLWIANPTALDSLVAKVVWSPADSALYDTARIVRTAPVLDLTKYGPDSLALALSAAAQADAKGRRIVSLSVGAVSASTVLQNSRSGNAAMLSLLASADAGTVWVHGLFVDPVFGDTARDSVLVPVLERTLQFVKASVTGPRGLLQLQATDPYTSGTTLSVKLIHGANAVTMLLSRDSSGGFSGSVPFTQARLASGDTLALGAPTVVGRDDSVVAVLAAAQARAALSDTARIIRPALSLVFSVDASAPQDVRMELVGGTPDAKGGAFVSFVKPLAVSANLSSASWLTWSGTTNLKDQLPESLDSVLTTGFFVDPLYGDTARAQIRIASPWYPGSISVSPDTADPRRGDSVTIVVRDHDPDSTKVDTVRVTSGARSWTLSETGRATGEYRLRLAASDLAPDWTAHAPRQAWNVTVRYQDPLHAQDVTEDVLALSFEVPPVQVAVHNPLVERPTTAQPGTMERSNGATGLVLVAQSDTVFHDGGVSIGDEPAVQGIAIRTWEPTQFSVYIYDQLGVAVNSWAGQVLSSDASKGALYLLRWDGRDKVGAAAGVGVYLVRVVRYAADGRYLGNDILRIGLR